MKSANKEVLIRELVKEHRPRRRTMPPLRRAVAWLAGGVLLTGILVLVVQPFRGGFVMQLLTHPLLLIELASELILVATAAFLLFSSAVPGRSVPHSTMRLLGLAAAVFGASVLLSFAHTPLTPEASSHGARHACWLEVLIDGGILMLLLALLLRRGYVRFSAGRGILLGLTVGLVPAAVMQLACMYSPSHALLFHYAPVAVLAVIGLLVMRLLHR